MLKVAEVDERLRTVARLDEVTEFQYLLARLAGKAARTESFNTALFLVRECRVLDAQIASLANMVIDFGR